MQLLSYTCSFSEFFFTQFSNSNKDVCFLSLDVIFEFLSQFFVGVGLAKLYSYNLFS